MAKYMSYVQILVEADTLAEAEDSLSASMSSNLKESGAILDWQYLPYNLPTEISDRSASYIFPELETRKRN